MKDSDADCNTLSNYSKETSGYIFNIVEGHAYLKSKKHTILVQSTMVSEIIVLPIASEEANWLRLFSTEIHLWEELILAMLIHFDSKTIIAKVENLYYKVQLR